MQDYDRRLRAMEVRSVSFFLIGVISLFVSGILVATRSATGQQTKTQVFTAPFRVTNSTGQVIFEVRDNPYGGKMILYAKEQIPILEASSSEMATTLFLREAGKGGTAMLGASTSYGFVIFKAKNGKTVFKKP